MQQDNEQYPHIGQFHWKYFQEQNGKRNVAVSSTVPRVDMMLDGGIVKEFKDNKKGVNYSVVFDHEYVFDYFYQKMVVNMGWANNGKVDINVLRCFLDDFLLHCETLHRNDDANTARAQAKVLAVQFPHKTAEQWKEELLGNASNNEKAMEPTQGNEKVYLADDTTRTEEKEGVADLGSKAEWIGVFDDEEENILATENKALVNEATDVSAVIASDKEEREITMDDYNPDIEEDCGDDHDIATKNIHDLKRMSSEVKIKGYGSMSKDDLIAAIIIAKRP